MPRNKLHKATLKGTIALYKKRKLPRPVSSAKGYMRGYGDIHQLLDRNIPIKLNGEVELTAKVVLVKPFLMGYRVAFSLGEFPVKEYTHFLHEFYQEEKKYEIEIVDGLNFEAEKYFDITANNWKLDNLIPKMLEANKVCKEISNSSS